MPFVSIRITREGTSAEQKAQVIREVTDTLERVLHKPPEWTHIAIEALRLGVTAVSVTRQRWTFSRPACFAKCLSGLDIRK
jgi:4-oxalocrotonate tautomerase family enzyme